jgi:hypothetical protein
MTTIHMPALSTITAHGLVTTFAQHARSAGRSAWLALERVGQRRAAHQLQLLAQQYQSTDPTLARDLRQAALDCRAGTWTDADRR